MSTVENARTQAPLAGGEWQVDASRSTVGFSLKHLLFKTVHGSFGEFEGTIAQAPGGPSARGTVAAASIDTGDAIRDGHLRDSEDFFDVARHPQISFLSTSITPGPGRRLRVAGDLTIRGTTRELVLDGTATPVDGGERIEIALRGEIDRAAHGITWNQTLDSGGALLGGRVRVELSISAVRRQPLP